MLCAFMPLANTVEKQNKTSEWYAKDISKKVKTGIKTKGMSGKPIVTEAPYQKISLNCITESFR